MKTHKAIRTLTITAILLLQVVFLTTMIVKEKYEVASFYTIMLIFFITLTVLFVYKYLDLHSKKYAYEKISVAIWVPIGAFICYSLNIFGDLGSVLSAGITGTLASFLPLINKESVYLKKLPPAIYCGAFVGMSSLLIAPSISFVIAAGILAGILFIFSKNLFIGIGGKLGTIAFGGVVLVSLIYWLLR